MACSSSPIRRHSGRSAVVKQRCRRCRRPAAVRKSLWRYQSERVLCRCGTARVRTPISAPLVWIRGGNWRGGRIGVRIVRRDRFHRLRCATPVVAVKTESALQHRIPFGPTGRKSNSIWGWAETCGVPELAAGGQAGHVEVFQVAAQGRDRAEFFRPLDFVFRIKTNLRVRKSIRLGGRRAKCCRSEESVLSTRTRFSVW